jgi:hypothetical protein
MSARTRKGKRRISLDGGAWGQEWYAAAPLRFIEENGHKILQQLYLRDVPREAEWRDVPLVATELDDAGADHG